MTSESSGTCPRSLEDVDLFGPDAPKHWYAAYDILHAEAPVHRVPGEGIREGADGYILTKYQDIARVVKNWERFPPVLYEVPPVADPENLEGPEDPVRFGFGTPDNPFIASIMSLRPTEDLWKLHRQTITDPWVGTGAMRHSEMIREKAELLIEDWIENGSVELVSAFAAPFPQHVLMTVLGYPMEDWHRIREWGNQQVRRFVYGKGHRNFLTVAEERDQAKVVGEFADYLLDLLKKKRANPADDMISWLAELDYQPFQRKLTDTEIVGIIYGMNLGGLETTQYAIVEQAQLICENPGLFETLKSDRKKVKFFVEESMRLRAPTQGLSTRMTTQDEVFQGVSVPAGSLIHFRLAAGNIDADQFECPKALRLDRKAPTSHLAFSLGPRSCPGQGISRVEQNIAWECLLDRLDGIRYADDVAFNRQPGIMLGLDALKINFSKA